LDTLVLFIRVKRLKVLSLTDNTPYILAWGNDEGFDRVFSEQLKNLGSAGDLLVAISGSGNSPNILRAVEWANAHGITTFGCTGFGGGKLPSPGWRTVAPSVPNAASGVPSGAIRAMKMPGKPFAVDEFKMEELVATGKMTEADISALLGSRHITVFKSSDRTTVNVLDTSLSRAWRDRLKPAS